jgi:hypothetical protein
MTCWQHAFRSGIAAQLPREGLVALRRALATGDKRLIQGTTTMPPPLQMCQDLPCERACAIAYCCAFTSDVLLKPVAEVEEFFARVCFQADQALGEPAACRWFLNWFDETPMEKVRPLLLAEVDAELARRRTAR